MNGLAVREELDMSLIEFKHVSYNVLRAYITGRRMYFNCRVNVYEDMILCIGVFYRGFLCGGTMLTRIDSNKAVIQTWYSRDGRAKMELLDYSIKLLRLLGFKRVTLPVQKKHLADLLNIGWKKSDKCLYMEEQE